ncbi:patatin-like phospholipase family protein [Photobacterium rosenbergii]|uniref:patatin-like phospholipase family protein n=1 Tax=Photobacterium rosenbergii TaxID=294936 RepID=UPI001C9A0456|nr:patatin-like phospholipase family protein [Photobacterium rosenbergii]MBY5947807.1 patatin-like phospholipase family protein [Photobacterium rosenbergii]
MKFRTRGLVASMLLLCSLPTLAGERPKIALVLGGGGAKGAAHIGVLKVLEENRIPVDFVSGTSIGAYVGGLYALGYDADQIETIMMSLDFNTGFSDEIPREQLSYRDKKFRDEFPIDPKMGWGDGKFKVAKGALQGQTMSSLIRRSIGLVPTLDNFDSLPVPFRAVATNMPDRSEVILHDGDFAEALQASMSVPGFLAPVKRDGKLLSDGGMVNNLPISIAKDQGADIVIAVDIGAPLRSEDGIDSVFAVVGQLSGFLTNENRNQQVAMLDNDDILIMPRVDGVKMTDFSSMKHIIPQGEIAAKRQLANLSDLSLSEAEYASYQQSKLRQRQQLVRSVQPITRLELQNNSQASDRLVLDKLKGLPKAEMDAEAVEDAVENVYALDQFERVGASIEKNTHNDESTLVVKTEEKSWGPNVFNAGVHFEDGFNDDLHLVVDGALTVNNLFGSGGQWRTSVTLGTDYNVATDWYQPLDSQQRVYTMLGGKLGKKRWNGLMNVEDAPFTRFNQKSSELYGGVGVNISNNAQVELAYRYEDGVFDAMNTNLLGDMGDYWVHGAELSIGYDTLNGSIFPTSGSQLTAKVGYKTSGSTSYFDSLSGQDDYWQYQLDWKGATHIGSHNLIGRVSVESVEQGKENLSNLVTLGGFLNLSGYARNSLVGNHKALATAVYTYQLDKNLVGTEWPVFVGASAEMGNVWTEKPTSDLDDWIKAGSVFVSAETSMGAAALSFGQADSGESSVYLFFGKPF